MTDAISTLSSTKIKSYQAFFERYRTFMAHSKQNKQREWLAYQFRLAEFKGAFVQAKKQKVREALRTAPEYNLFHVLGVSHLEMRTHSAFLAHLLNPDSSHGQQFLFLQSFLAICSSLKSVLEQAPFPVPNTDISRHDWEIVCEQSTSYGRMDVVITCPDLGYLYVIENKVGAGEQKGQLSNYGHWMKKQEEFDKQALIFLTPAGRKSHTNGAFDYFRLSYYNDITHWLSSLIDAIQPANVKNALAQYLQLWKI